jgi:hypothetical protein
MQAKRILAVTLTLKPGQAQDPPAALVRVAATARGDTSCSHVNISNEPVAAHDVARLCAVTAAACNARDTVSMVSRPRLLREVRKGSAMGMPWEFHAGQGRHAPTWSKSPHHAMLPQGLQLPSGLLLFVGQFQVCTSNFRM